MFMYLHNGFVEEIIQPDEVLEGVSDGGGGYVTQQVGKEVPPRLEEVQHSKAHYVVQIPILKQMFTNI